MSRTLDDNTKIQISSQQWPYPDPPTPAALAKMQGKKEAPLSMEPLKSIGNMFQSKEMLAKTGKNRTRRFREARSQQDTIEYLNQRGTWIGVFWESKRGDKGRGEEWRSGGRVNRAWRGKRGEKWGKWVGGKGPESTLKKPWFRYPYDLGVLL